MKYKTGLNNKVLKIFSGVVVLVLVSKALGFIRESFIAARYGAGFISDVYVFEDGLVNSLYTVWAGVISTTFVPLALNQSNIGKDKFASNYLNLLMFIVIAITAIIFIFPEPILHIFVPGFFSLYSSDVISNLIIVTRINSLSLILVFLENFFIVYLQSKKIFIFSSIQGIVLNAFLILYLIFFYQFGILGIILSKIGAHIVNIVVLLVFINKKRLFHYSLYISTKEKYVSEIVKLGTPVFILNVISQMNYIVDSSVASGLDAGSMALINYANVIATLLYSVLGITMTTMAYTEMSSHQDDNEKLQNEFSRFFKLLINVITPALIVMIIMREKLVTIFYGRGQIGADSIDIIALILLLYIPGYYLMSLRDLMNRLMYIHKKTIAPSFITGLTFILNIILNLALVRIIGIYGLALATSVSSLLATMASYMYIKKMGFFNYQISFNIKKVFMLIISVIVCFFINENIGGSLLMNIISLGISSFCVFVIYDFDIFYLKLRH